MRTPDSTLSALLPYRHPKATARWRLICFPYAGASASLFRGWDVAVGDEIEVCAVQLPGRENRLAEPVATEVGPVVTELHDALRPVLDRPFALFGYSLGAIFAYELARALEQSGDRYGLEWVFVAARTAPRHRSTVQGISALPDVEFLQGIRSLGGGLDPVLADAELRDLFVPILRGDLRLSDTYHPSELPPLRASLCAFGGTRDPSMAPADVRAWGRCTTGRFRYRPFDRGHFFLEEERDALIETIQDCLSLGRHEGPSASRSCM
jgi:medium-chain acyl-[acyl-carrier-protein] hydrolase